MKVAAAIAGGLAGTLTVASLHEGLRRVTPTAPRMDLLDMELIRKGLHRMNRKVPGPAQLQRWAAGGELLCDTAYFSMAALGGKRGVWLRGAVLGLAAGVLAVVLPKPLGLPGRCGKPANLESWNFPQVGESKPKDFDCFSGNRRTTGYVWQQVI